MTAQRHDGLTNGGNTAPPKDPQAILSYSINWAAWLVSDTIASVVWTVPVGITSVSQSNTTTVATIKLSGGSAGDAPYPLNCHIVTAGGFEDDRTLFIPMQDR
jgi:hypothetical protein